MGKPCIYSSILNNRRQYVLKTRLFDQNRHGDWFFIKFFLIRGFGLAHYRYVVRKRGGSYVEALNSVDKRSDAGDTFDSRKKRKKKMLASLLEIK